ncbi:hypothetical protein AVEN_140888-1, partial [Araneus ventricosus]
MFEAVVSKHHSSTASSNLFIYDYEVPSSMAGTLKSLSSLKPGTPEIRT